MIVTTGGRYNDETLSKAKDIARRYNIKFVMRKKLAVEEMKTHYDDDIIVVGNDEISISPKEKVAVKYHPNFALVRAKRLLNKEKDALIEAAELESGMSFLDCTMGLAADSVIASLAAGPAGKVIALERSFIIYLTTREGLASYDTNIKEIDDAMRRVETIHQDYTDYLKTCSDNSFDIVYFDPMFTSEISSSQSLRAIEKVTHNESLNKEAVDEAKRVARRKVVLKDHFRSTRFEEFGFKQHIRKTSKVHYGVISMNSEFDF